MEKQKLSITKKPPISFEYRGYNVVMDTFISPVQESIIVHEYASTLFKDDNQTDDLLLSQWQLVLSVTDKLTNLPIMEESENIGLEDLITSGLWNEIKSHIVNYDELLDTIDTTVEQIQNEKALSKSMGHTIDKLVERGTQLFDKISQIDFSQEAIKELVTALQTETSKFEETVLAKAPEKPVRKRKSNGTAS